MKVSTIILSSKQSYFILQIGENVNNASDPFHHFLSSHGRW